MISNELVQEHHTNRLAVIYIRQSTSHQVLTNLESRKMQHAMRETARALGWDETRIESVECDTGVSAQSTAGRTGYQTLLGRIAVGGVGLVLSYESTRLSRNCTDWYPLLDVCALARCLIADRDGVYDPSTPNGRLLLGMKGIVSEVELHTLRGRLLAGIAHKAQRGELALPLPVGLVRLEDGRVVKNPDVHVQEMITLVFDTFLARGTAIKVVHHLRERGLLQPRRRHNQETVWTSPSVASVLGVLQNPAYAGAFVYGKTQSVLRRDGRGARRRRRALEDWRVIIRDRYPAYVAWDTFVHVQATLRDNYAEYNRNLTRGVPRDGAALLHGITYCGACGHKMVVHYQPGGRYLCSYFYLQAQGPVCQSLPAAPIDAAVVQAFFAALAPLELDAYERAVQVRRAQQAEVERAQARELERLHYEVQLARRQYDRVDPDNRLVAAELERRWEAALRTLRATEARFACQGRDEATEEPLTDELRAALSSLGESLPRLWHGSALTRAQRKALLRCLIDKVVLYRRTRECVHTRIVWQGGAVTELAVPIAVHARRDLPNCEELETKVLAYEAAGMSDDEIACLLTEQGFRSPMRTTVLPSTVRKIRRAHGRIHRFHGPRPRRVAGYLTLPQLAEAIGVKPHWLYHQIRRGTIPAQRDPKTKLYLFPDNAQTRARFRKLCDHIATNVSS